MNMKFLKKHLNIILLIIIVLLILYYSTVKEKFTPINFDEDYLLVMYYTEWCGYSQQALPHFVGVGNMYQTRRNKGVKLLALDCDKHRADCREANISGYPTIILYKKNDLSFRKEYQGPRKTVQITSWLEKNTN